MRRAASLTIAALAVTALVAAVSMAGSLYLSEGGHLVPCRLCWYQRSMMYPLAIILVIAAFRRNWGIRPYAVTLAVLGLAGVAYAQRDPAYADDPDRAFPSGATLLDQMSAVKGLAAARPTDDSLSRLDALCR